MKRIPQGTYLASIEDFCLNKERILKEIPRFDVSIQGKIPMRFEPWTSMGLFNEMDKRAFKLVMDFPESQYRLPVPKLIHEGHVRGSGERRAIKLVVGSP